MHNEQEQRRLIPCDFIRFIANVRDDLDQLGFQLMVNHAENYPSRLVARREQEDTNGLRAFGKKLVNMFKPTRPPQPSTPSSGFTQKGQSRMAFHSKNTKSLANLDLQALKVSEAMVSEPVELTQEDLRSLNKSKSLKKRSESLSRHTLQYQEESIFYRPIYKLNRPVPYTQDEWVIILMNSIHKIKARDRIAADLGLQIEHLSAERVRASFYQGLEHVAAESLRGEIWKMICKVHNSKSQYKRHIIDKFIEQEDPKAEQKIMKDLKRTFPTVAEFKTPHTTGQNRLYNVLKAYSAYDPEISYCQGMNFIAGILLQVIPDQEDAFWCMVFVMFVRDWRSIFLENDNTRIQQMISDLESFVKRNCKSVFNHMKAEEVATFESCFSTQLISLFIYDSDLEQAIKIFELFLFEGEQVLLNLLGGMVIHKKRSIVRLTELELMNYLRKDMVTECLTEMSISEILTNANSGQPINVPLTVNSVTDSIY